MPKKTAHDPDILRGMARGPWAVHWANEAEEAGESFSGVDLYEIAPKTPRWAEKWARRLADSIAGLNQASLSELYQHAVSVGYSRDKESFGYHLGMQSTGEGVSWSDDSSAGHHGDILLPYYVFYEGAETHDPDIRFARR